MMRNKYTLVAGRDGRRDDNVSQADVSRGISVMRNTAAYADQNDVFHGLERPCTFAREKHSDFNIPKDDIS